MDDQDRLGRALSRMYLALCIGALVASLIHLAPEHQRRMAKLRMLRWCVQVTNRLARHTGAASMAAELRTGDQEYELPYLLSCTRDALGRAYQRAAGTP